MSRTLLLVGTRKGLFMLESDADRKNWSMRGAYCEGWPVYHAVFDRDSGAIYAAAASEWHGSSIWRSADLGETWTQSSEGLAYEDGRKMSKVSSLSAAHGRVLVGVEAPGIFESRDDGATWSPYSMLAGQPGSEDWDDSSNQPPGHLGISAITADEKHPDSRLGDRAGRQPVRDDRRRQDVDAAKPWPAHRLAARARGGRLLRPQVRPLTHRCGADVPAEPRRHASLGRCRRDVDGDHRRVADGVRVCRCSPSPRPRHLPCHPARSGPWPHDARRSSGGVADEGRGLELGASRERPPAGERAPRRLAPRNHGRQIDTPGYYFGTSTGQVYASADDGESWSEIASYLPAISSVEVAIVD